MNTNVQKILNINLQKYVKCQKKQADQLALNQVAMVDSYVYSELLLLSSMGRGSTQVEVERYILKWQVSTRQKALEYFLGSYLTPMLSHFVQKLILILFSPKIILMMKMENLQLALMRTNVALKQSVMSAP